MKDQSNVRALTATQDLTDKIQEVLKRPSFPMEDQEMMTRFATDICQAWEDIPAGRYSAAWRRTDLVVVRAWRQVAVALEKWPDLSPVIDRLRLDVREAHEAVTRSSAVRPYFPDGMTPNELLDGCDDMMDAVHQARAVVLALKVVHLMVSHRYFAE